MGPPFEKNKGQALLEALLVMPGLILIIFLGLKSLRWAWVEVSAEQISYECALCLLKRNSRQVCIQKTQALADQLGIGLKGRVENVSRSGLSSQCELSFRDGKKWIKKSASLNEVKVKRVSRKYFWRQAY